MSSPAPGVRDILALAKPRLSLLVLFTTGGGMLLAPGTLAPAAFTLTLVSTLLIVAAANALNSYIETENDGLMYRTQGRPLPAGRVRPDVALYLGLGVAAVALPVLGMASNWLTAGLGAVAFVLYVAVYTPLKRYTTLALLVGAVPGAMPALMGWTAVTGTIDPAGVALFAILFVWQLPHFLAISVYLRDDYARGGFKVFSGVHGVRAAKAGILLSVVLMIPVTMSLVPLGVANEAYGTFAMILGVGFLYFNVLGVAGPATNQWARRVFLASLVYLTFLYGALIAGVN